MTTSGADTLAARTVTRTATRTATRRGFLSLAAGSAAVAALGSCRRDTSTASGLTSSQVGDGPIGITIWVQDFAASIDGIRRAARAYVRKAPEVSVTIQVIPYATLRAKVVPAVAAGTEAEIINAYNSWFVANDISRMFLGLDPFVGGRSALERLVFPNALDATAAPGGRLFYVPNLSGMNAATITVNRAQFGEAGIDYTRLRTWEDLVDAGKELTVRANGRMQRAGLSPIGTYLDLMQSWIWQQGGEFYDRERGRWSFSTDHGMAAIGRLADLFWKHKVCSFDLLQPTTGIEDFLRGRVSANTAGVWQIGSLEASDPSLRCDGITTPPLADADSNVLYGDEIGAITLSRRLADDPVKRKHCIAIVRGMLAPGALLAMTDVYSGTLASKQAYADPGVAHTKYGAMTKRIAYDTWPRLRFSKDRVADKSVAGTEIERGLRREISLREALANADAALQESENLAFQRQHQGRTP